MQQKVIEMEDYSPKELEALEAYSLQQNRLLVQYWNRRNRRHRANKSKKLSTITSGMKLKPLSFDEPETTSTFWSVVVTKKNGDRKLCADFDHNVFPSVTIDYIHNMAFVDTTASKRGFGCIALTADTSQTLNGAVTALTGEITSPTGLARVEAGTKTHTAASNSTLVEHTFTLNGSQSDITRAALFNVATAPVSGTIGPVAAFSNGATGAMVSGETVKVSITINTS